MTQPGRVLAESIARAARSLQAQASPQETLQRMVELTVRTVPGCEHAGVSLVTGSTVSTPAASSTLPVTVDQIQYATGQGPCLAAIGEHRTERADDLLIESRWPAFSTRAVTETGVRSMLSFRLFLAEDTFGALNLYSTRPGAFDADSQYVGEVFAAHAAVALQAAQEHEQVEAMTEDLETTRLAAARYAAQAGLAVALQRSLLTELPDLSPLQVAARYLPATEAAEVGGDWYDAFVMPDGFLKFTVGDIAGHDIDAAAAMGQARSLLRALAVDRQEPPGQLLDRFDMVLSRLLPGRTGTCVCGHLRPSSSSPGGFDAVLGSAGHPPPLLISDGAARYIDLPSDLLLGTGTEWRRSSTPVVLPAGTTLLLYTDGLIERRDRHLRDGLDQLRSVATDLAAAPVEELCDQLLARLVPTPTDDVCLLAVHVPPGP